MQHFVGSASFGLMPTPVTLVGDPAGTAPHLEAASPSHKGLATLPRWPMTEPASADHRLLQAFALAIAANGPEHHDASGAGWPNFSWLRHIRRWSQAPSHQL